MTTTIRQVIVATAAILLTFTGAALAADVPFVTGGVGVDERADLRAKEKDYNLKIVAAAPSGAYVADVAVVIESAAVSVRLLPALLVMADLTTMSPPSVGVASPPA